MKINLQGIYKDIKPLVDAPLKPDVKAPTEHQFNDVLASISPFSDKKNNIINKLTGSLQMPGNNSADTDKIYGMSRLIDPQLKTPETELIQSVIAEGLQSEQLDPGVKTPSIVRATRLKADPAFSRLSQAERMDEVKKMVEKAGNEHGIDPLLSMSVVSAESSFDSNAVSSDGHASKGLFQFIDSTGSDAMTRAGLKSDYNPFDPRLNVKLGVTHLRYLHEIFSQATNLPNNLVTVAAANSSSLEKLAVAAFNAGEGRVASAQVRAKRDGLDPSEYDQIESYLPVITQEYVRRVINRKEQFGAKFSG